jgi:uncharacterized membrane protein YsdA (DUF1294 family)
LKQWEIVSAYIVNCTLEGLRIPEVVLHSFAFAGGALGVLISQRLL